MEIIRQTMLYSRQDIACRVQELGQLISHDYRDRDLVLVGVLKGAFIFMADLIRCVSIPCTVDFIRAASYGATSTSSGEVTIVKDLELDIAGKDVLLVEDIVDTGTTLQCLVRLLQARGPQSLKVCALIDKRLRRCVEINADYIGFSLDDGFLVGYGLDYNEAGRFFPDIYIAKV